MNDVRHRRLFGIFFGAALGLGYGLSSQYINFLTLPGISLHQPPFGPLPNALIWSLVGALLGFICAWPANSIAGVFFSSVAGALLIWGVTFASDPAPDELLSIRIIAAAVFMVPLVALLVPILAVHRYAVAREVDGWLSRSSLLLRGWLPVTLVLLTACIGLTSRYGRVARAELTSLHTMIQDGLAAPDDAHLPRPLQHHLVGGFKDHAVPDYGLSWENEDINRFGIPRMLSPSPNEEGAALAYFSNGWKLACIYPSINTPPSCRGYQSQFP